MAASLFTTEPTCWPSSCLYKTPLCRYNEFYCRLAHASLISELVTDADVKELQFPAIISSGNGVPNIVLLLSGVGIGSLTRGRGDEGGDGRQGLSIDSKLWKLPVTLSENLRGLQARGYVVSGMPDCLSGLIQGQGQQPRSRWKLVRAGQSFPILQRQFQ